ncbi:MAG: hypothetical protein AAF432_14260 [Planctomycetota bacterium]
MSATRIGLLALAVASTWFASGPERAPSENAPGRGETAGATAGADALQQVIVDLWTPDKDVVRDAIARSHQFQDERVQEALIGRFLFDAPGHDPRYWYVLELIEALAVQHVRVAETNQGWLLTDGHVRRVVPYRLPEIE